MQAVQLMFAHNAARHLLHNIIDNKTTGLQFLQNHLFARLNCQQSTEINIPLRVENLYVYVRVFFYHNMCNTKGVFSKYFLHSVGIALQF